MYGNYAHLGPVPQIHKSFSYNGVTKDFIRIFMVSLCDNHQNSLKNGINKDLSHKILCKFHVSIICGIYQFKLSIV
jgi:hypothetical protein